MRSDQAPTIRLADYTPPAFLVDEVHLTFRLAPSKTRVLSRLSMRRNPDAGPGQDLRLDGRALTLISAAIDGKAVAANTDDEGLTLPADALPESFTFEAETEIDPQGNTALEGLYMSKGMYCTQCEAQGFRKITYFPDRPDVMATYTVRIEGDAPVMLSNGNPVAQGDGWAEWHDPWPKPSYLFALVAGDLVSHDDTFTTASGRAVDLKIYVRPGDEAKCEYAMDALKRSMRWDETEYGREYDLDLFIIVAVDDFNMGAMENKGLNIFNSKYVLASPDTATDRDYEFIEGIIAHEYFHNWTGNRITCRDWFQLCLKEGLTVFRDQQFSGDMRSHAVKRIDDVMMLRARQFREDQGPLAHPVRPEEYIEINNFYTATVYEKGAELIGMLRTLVGPEAYRKALDLYFSRHDGQACTIEDWIAVFEDTTGRDLGQFKRWYSQAGTPTLTYDDDWNGDEVTITIRQATALTPGQPTKQPLHMPIALGALHDDGSSAAPTRIVELTQTEQSFTIPVSPAPKAATQPGAPMPPILSVNRGFSAPVIVQRRTPLSSHDRYTLMANDPDPFNRWDVGRNLARESLAALTIGSVQAPSERLLDAYAKILSDTGLDPAFKALALAPPSIEEVFKEVGKTAPPPDPADIQNAVARLETALAHKLGADLRAGYEALAVPGRYSPDAKAAGKRALRGRLLSLLTRVEDDAATARTLFARADNMTETMQALALLVRAGAATEALGEFHDRWKGDALVLDKWFSVQAANLPAASAADTIAELTGHPDFDWRNPNRFRALIAVFAMSNLPGFHRADGAGYTLLADWLIRLDPVNPQTTARLTTAFETWRQFDEGRQALILPQLQRIADLPGLSKDSAEMIGRILEAKAGQ